MMTLHYTKQHAYTLIEMLTVLAILAIAAAFVVPQYEGFMQRESDERLQQSLIDVVSSAQSYVRLNRLTLAVCHTQDGNSCNGSWADGFLLFVNETADGVVRSKQQVLEVYQLHAKGELRWRQFPKQRNYLLFSTINSALNTNGTFWFCHANTPKPTWAIMVNKLSRARVVYPDKTGVIKDSHGKALVCE